MSVTPSPIGGFAAQFFDNNGQPLSGGKIYTYAAGTTLPQATYTSALGIQPHSNPIELDSAGRVPGGEIWLTDGLVYKFKIETSTGALIGTYDNITGVNSNFVNYTVQEEVQTATAGQTVFNLSTINYTPGTNSLSVYIDGVNQYVGDSYLETDSDTVTFTAGLHVGAEVKFTTAVQTTTGAMDASNISYTAGFTGAVSETVQTKLEQFISVEDFGAVGDGVTDDTAAIQDALDAANGGTLYFEAKTYKTTASLVIPGHTTKIEGRGAIIDYYGSAHAIGYALVGGTTYPVETGIRQLGINVNSGIGASGIQLRTSYSQFEEVVITLRVGAVSARGFVLVGDETNGTGPYYNMFLRCGVQSGSGGADHIGVSFVASAPIYRSPNANTWIGGRIGQCATGIIIKGAGNTFINPTIENAALTGTAIKFEADTSVNCTQNQVFGSYIENANIAVQFTANANFNSIYSQFLTGVGTDVSDLGTNNLIIDTNSPAKLPLGVEFGTLSSDANVLDYYEEGTWVPTLVGGTTAGSYSIATSTAKFTRIGNQVTLSAQMAITVNSAGTGDLRFGGLPFPKGANSVLVGNVSTRNIAINASIVSLNAVQWTTSADATFAIGGVRNNTSLLFLTCADVSAGAAVDVSITYYV
jgi:hypothetical protein